MSIPTSFSIICVFFNSWDGVKNCPPFMVDRFREGGGERKRSEPESTLVRPSSSIDPKGVIGGWKEGRVG